MEKIKLLSRSFGTYAAAVLSLARWSHFQLYPRQIKIVGVGVVRHVGRPKAKITRISGTQR